MAGDASTFQITSPDAKRLADSFRRSPEVTERYAQAAVNASIQEVFKHATEENLPWRTGRLTRSFGEGIEIGRLYGTIQPTVSYAAAVHERSSKPQYMPRLMELARPKVVEYFEQAIERVAEELAE